MDKKKSLADIHVVKACYWSMKGMQAAWKNEIAFRQEILIIIFLLPLGLWWGRTASEKILLSSVLLIVLMIELLNSAIEAAIDRSGTEKHPLAGRAKDMGSAAVFIALINVILVWGIVFFDRTF